MSAGLPSGCIVLVPAYTHVHHETETCLRGLERRGYPVHRVFGCSNVAAVRNHLATDALAKRWQELMWVDADVVFDPDDVEKLRAHALPFACGLYALKRRRGFACDFLPGTPPVRFGEGGGLTEIGYAGFGFNLVRREVFAAIAAGLGTPVPSFDLPPAARGAVPFFEPMTVRDAAGTPDSLGEDYSFCERARRAGFKIMADTTIRLWHVGDYRYGWEDALGARDRHPGVTFDPFPAPPVPAEPDAPPA